MQPVFVLLGRASKGSLLETSRQRPQETIDTGISVDIFDLLKQG